jgi:hypothetical protein
MCLVDDGSKPTLYIKANIIDLYFISISQSLSLELIEVKDRRAIYLIGIDEKEVSPFYMFSSVETLSEKTALELILSSEEFDIILFNDYALEIARAAGKCDGSAEAKNALQHFVPTGPDYSGNDSEMEKIVSDYIESKGSKFVPNLKLSRFESDARSTVISGHGSVMNIAGFSSATEVHEMLPQIVGDHTLLHFEHSPEVEMSENKRREFSDAMILGGSAFLSIQAKSFDFEGDVPPTSRSNAEKRMRKNVTKAVAQTKGSSRALRERRKIFSKKTEITIPSDAIGIFCIFVPSLDLISGHMDDVLCQLGDYLKKHGHDLVVLDPMQFLRTVQAAEQAAKLSGSVPDEVFFDLLQRNSRQAAAERNYTRPILYRW